MTCGRPPLRQQAILRALQDGPKTRQEIMKLAGNPKTMSTILSLLSGRGRVISVGKALWALPGTPLPPLAYEQAILEAVRHHALKVGVIQRLLNLSYQTARKTLQRLAAEGRVLRFRGALWQAATLGPALVRPPTLLTERSKQLIALREQGRTFKEIAEEFDVTPQFVQQVLKRDAPWLPSHVVPLCPKCRAHRTHDDVCFVRREQSNRRPSDVPRTSRGRYTTRTNPCH